MPVKWKGLGEFKANLRKAEPRMLHAVAAAILQEGYALDAVMVPNIPFRTGRLRGSHFVSPPKSLSDIVVLVGVGTDYAIYVENAKRGTQFAVGGRKFLSNAINVRRPGFGKRVGIRAKAHFVAGTKVGSVVSSQAPPQPQEE